MNYKRSNRILTEKFLRYLVPTIITTLALSLNEFVDSMMVANLLGSQAMSIVNLGSPIILIMAAIYTLLGNGGSTLYAVNLGKWQQDEAGKILTVSMLTAGASGFFLLFAGLILQQPIISLVSIKNSIFIGEKYLLRISGCCDRSAARVVHLPYRRQASPLNLPSATVWQPHLGELQA